MAEVRFNRLDELDTDSWLVQLSDTKAAQLALTELVEVQPPGAGTWRVLPNGRVGSVRIGDLQDDVTSKGKVGLTQLLFLLGYAQDPGFRDDEMIDTADADLWTALGFSLVRPVDRALAQGVLQGYLAGDGDWRQGNIPMSIDIAHSGVDLTRTRSSIHRAGVSSGRRSG